MIRLQRGLRKLRSALGVFRNRQITAKESNDSISQYLLGKKKGCGFQIRSLCVRKPRKNKGFMTS